MALSPDGKTILTGGTDKTAQLWDARSNRPIGPPIRHQGPVVAVAFSPDSKTVVTASSDGTVRLWDVEAVPDSLPIFSHELRVSGRGLQSRRQDHRHWQL